MCGLYYITGWHLKIYVDKYCYKLYTSLSHFIFSSSILAGFSVIQKLDLNKKILKKLSVDRCILIMYIGVLFYYVYY